MKIKSFEIVRREYLERVKKKSFWISTIIFPVFILAISILPAVLARVSLQKNVKIAVIDLSGNSFEKFRESLMAKPGKKSSLKNFDDSLKIQHAPETETVKDYIVEKIAIEGSLETTLEKIKKEIGSGNYEGCVVINKNLSDPDSYKYYGRSVSNMNLLINLNRALDSIYVSARLDEKKITGLSPEELGAIVKGVSLETFMVEKGGASKKSRFEAAFLTTFVFVFILYMSLLIYGIANLRGVMEEKNSRIMELLLSTFTPRQLMGGKLMGIGLVGLTQMGIYALSMLAFLIYGAIAAMTMDPNLAEAIKAFNPWSLLYFIIFFVLGYFIYSAIFLGIGSLCSSEEDAQNMQSAAVIPLVIPMVLTMFFINNPESSLTVALSHFPLFTPLIMLMRVMVLTPPWWEIWISIAVSVLFLIFTLWAVAKVFRIGVLMYGKKPSFKEVFRWIREK